MSLKKELKGKAFGLPNYNKGENTDGKFLKGKSAVLIHRTVLGKKQVSGLHFWARGY
jgi:hypothetical protein